jgi:hypothetical protein
MSLFKYVPDKKPAFERRESDSEALNRTFQEWGTEFANILERVLAGKLNAEEKQIQKNIIGNIEYGEDRMLGVVLSIASYILYEQLASGEYKALDGLVTKQEVKATFAEAYMKSRGKKL